MEVKAWDNQEKCSQTTLLISGQLSSTTCELIIWTVKQAGRGCSRSQEQLWVGSSDPAVGIQQQVRSSAQQN